MIADGRVTNVRISKQSPSMTRLFVIVANCDASPSQNFIAQIKKFVENSDGSILDPKLPKTSMWIILRFRFEIETIFDDSEWYFFV